MAHASDAREPATDVLSSAHAGPLAVRGGGLRVASYIVGAVASAGSAALVFRHLGRDGTGTYVLVFTLVAIVGGISDLGLTAVGVREASLARGRERTALLRDLLGLRLTLTVIGTAVMVIIASLVYPAAVTAGVAIAGVALLAQATQDNYAVILQVQLRLGWVAALETIRQLVTAVFMAMLVVVGAQLLGFVSASVVAGTIVVILAGALVRAQRSLMPSFGWQRWRRLLAQILPYSAAVAASILYFRMAIVLVSLLADHRQLGLFGASFRIIEALYAVPGLLAATALPIFARAAQEDHRRLGYALGRVFEVALIVGAWVAVSLAVGASLAIAIIGGSEFAAAAPVLAVEGLALGAAFVGAVWANALLSLRLNRAILVINASLMALSAVVIGILVRVDGAQGAAIGTAIGEILGALASAFAVARRRPELHPSLKVVPKVATAAALGCSPMLMSGVPVIARLLASTALYGAVLLVTRALPVELKDLIPRLPWHRA